MGFNSGFKGLIYALPETIIANSKDAYEKYVQISYTISHSNREKR